MLEKQLKRKKRHLGIRKRVVGTSERPRLCVNRSLKNLYVQVIDDSVAKTIFSFSTRTKGYVGSTAKLKKAEKAAKLGEFFAQQLKEKGIQKIAFDRAGYKYHGRIKALAESLRQAGIEF